MEELELIQVIGNEICEGCGSSRDCGLEYDDCFRISNALEVLQNFLEDIKEQPNDQQ